ncbi:hypothetical protein WJX74_010721 [Apatococcus lobatus]|uniref:Fe2OG dioxygenase domain-containing protein n=1 Tax=Apatococcus lobatus TaxID=904363 RepID=A0AAW1RM59_9CHLO
MSSARLSQATLFASRVAPKRKAGVENSVEPKRPKPAETPRQAKPAEAQQLHRGLNTLSKGCEVIYEPVAVADPGKRFADLQKKVNWLQKEITVMGRKVMQPREIAYMADNGLRYTYSKTQLEPEAFPTEVQDIKNQVERLANARFNCCLLNHYRDGKDNLGWHSDNEKLFGPKPTIASVSLGARRDFVLRRNSDHSQKWKCSLGEGDILIMKGRTQSDWMHSIPKRSSCGPRINLTFRRIVEEEAAQN